MQPWQMIAIKRASAGQLASSRHLLVCVDDGTISNIVTDPMPHGWWQVEALEMLEDLPNTSVAVVSGGAGQPAHHVAMPAGIHLVGGHGAEVDVHRADPGSGGCWINAQRHLELVLDSGAFIETKPGSIAIHVRRCGRRPGRISFGTSS